jgi:hypothetical protein
MTQLLDDDVGKVEKVESDLISFKVLSPTLFHRRRLTVHREATGPSSRAA